MLTGDGEEATDRVASLLGLDSRAACRPGDKLERIGELEREFGPTLMIGDGVNDGPALSRASIGAAVCGATAVAKAVAPVNVIGDDLRLVGWATALSRRTMRIVRQNLGWAIGYNAVCVALAVGGHLNPVVAALAMLASSACVVFNSLRIGRFPALAAVAARSAAAVEATADRDGPVNGAIIAPVGREAAA
jgi:P-type E1-E2 ATPase